MALCCQIVACVMGDVYTCCVVQRAHRPFDVRIVHVNIRLLSRKYFLWIINYRKNSYKMSEKQLRSRRVIIDNISNSASKAKRTTMNEDNMEKEIQKLEEESRHLRRVIELSERRREVARLKAACKPQDKGPKRFHRTSAFTTPIFPVYRTTNDRI